MAHASADAQWPALDELVTEIIDAHRTVAAAQAAESDLFARAADLITDRIDALRQEAQASGRRPVASSADLPVREVALELGAALRLSDRGVQTRISDAYTVRSRFPATRAAWSAGEIDAAHAIAITRAGSPLDDPADRERYEQLALAVAAIESPARTASAVRAIAATIRPDLFADGAREASRDRSVRVYDLEDGMARLLADLPAPLAHAIADRLTQMARAADLDAAPDEAAPDGSEEGVPLPRQQRVVTEGGSHRGRPNPGGASSRDEARDGADGRDLRTLDQRRADLLCDLLLTGTPSGHSATLGAIRGRIQVTIPALTLAGATVATAPALLAGSGPIDPDLARTLAGLAAGWDRVFTDPYTGEPLATDRYRPTAAIRRYLAARDERCRAPGCNRPVYTTDADHTVDAARGGPTCDDNLGHFCRRHHTCKHLCAWRVRQLGRGVLEWTGPTGRRYLDRPPAVVRFVPDGAADPPPF